MKLIYTILLVSCLFIPVSFSQELRGNLINLYPWGYYENGVFKGKQIEIIRAIEKESGVKLSYEVKSLNEMVNDLVENKTDFTMLFRRPQFEKSIIPLGVVEKVPLYIIFLKGKSTSLKKINSIAYLKGEKGLIARYLKNHNASHISIVKSSNSINMFSYLKNRNVDAAIFPGNLLETALNKKVISLEELDWPEVITTRKVYFMVARDRPNTADMGLIKKLRKAILKLNEKGILKISMIA